MFCGRGFNCHNSDFTAYSNAKLYNQLTAVELQKRLEGSGVDIYVARHVPNRIVCQGRSQQVGSL